MLFCSSTATTFLHCLKLSLIELCEVICSRFTPAIDAALPWHWKQYCLNVGSGFGLASTTQSKTKRPARVNLRQGLRFCNIRLREIFISTRVPRLAFSSRNHCLV